jgi:hypothetical protein
MIIVQIILLISSHILALWLCVSSLLIGFSGYYISITYIRYRFKQVNHKIEQLIKSSKNKLDYHLLIKAIEEHNQITVLCIKNNQFVNLILLIIYYFYSPAIDIALFLTIYVDIFYIKLFGFFMTFNFILFLFIFSLTTAQLQKSAHFSYKNLNSIIAKEKCIPQAQKIKIVGLIERLAGPDIAVYCHDFFPLNYYEFYLFIAIISSNFFLFMSLIA